MPWTTPETFTAGQTLTAASMNAITENTRVLRGIRYQRATRTSGNITLASASYPNWTNVDTGMDVSLNASAGDLIEVAISATLAANPVLAAFDVVTVVSGSAVNSFAADGAAPSTISVHNGIQAWLVPTSVETGVGGSAFRTLVAGDISSSTVTLRLRFALASATNRTLYASTAAPFVVWAMNHGQANP